jgi:hypothetical protein
MTPQIIVLLFWVAVIVVVWLVFRSKFFRGACEDIEAMNNAPEYKGKAKRFEAYMANPMYQLTVDKEKEDASKGKDHAPK